MKPVYRASAASSEAPKARLAHCCTAVLSVPVVLHCIISVPLAPLSLTHCTRGRMRGGGGRGGGGGWYEAFLIHMQMGELSAAKT